MAVAEYAVVTFTDDKDVSEVPSKWIQENDDDDVGATCWWPTNSKNITTLIAKQAQPDKKTWTLMPVIVEKYCATLAKARKIAENANYQTTDDDNLGKGHRVTVQKRLISNSSDDETEDEQPSKTYKRLKTRANILREQDILNDLPSTPVSSDQPSTSHDQSCNQIVKAGLEKAKTLSSNNDIINVDELVISENDDMIASATTREGVNSAKKKTIPTVVMQPSLPVPQESIEVPDNVSQNKPKDIEEVQLRNTSSQEDSLMIRMLAKVLVAIEDLSKKIEHGRTPTASGDIDVVTSYLPLKSIKEIEDFENIIRVNAKVKEQFNTFVRKIGGRTARDDIQRILKKVFTDPCAELCSWKGRKGNFCIEELFITKAISKAVMETYPAEKEFTFQENVAEWFRFSKQRDSRHTAKANKKQNKRNCIQEK